MWLSLNECSVLLNVTIRNIRYRISKNYYIVRRIASNHSGAGFVYEISLESLPLEAQQRYWQQVKLAQEIAASKPHRGRPTKAAKQAQEEAKAAKQAEIQANQIYAEAPRWQKDTVDLRLQIVQETLGMGRKELENWIMAHGLDLSVATVYRWRKAFAEGGKNALMTGYGQTKGQSIIPDDVFNFFQFIWMRGGFQFKRLMWRLLGI